MGQRIISAELLATVIAYVEKMEVTYEAECGSLRSLAQLEADDALPDFLYDLRAIQE